MGESVWVVRKSLADYQRGVDLVSAGHYDLAIAPLEDCLRQENGFTEAGLLLIRILRRIGRYSEALSIIRGFLGGQGEAIEISREAVPIALFAGQPSLALRSAWRVLERLPALGHRRIAVPSAMGSSPGSAMTDEVDLRNWLVLIALFEKGARTALRAVRHCVQRDSLWLKGHYLHAGILEIQGDYARAEDAYTRILEIDPAQSEPLAALRRLWRGATMEKNPFRDEYIHLFIAEGDRLIQEDPTEPIARAVESWSRSFPGELEFVRILVRVLVPVGQHNRALEAIDRIPVQRLSLDVLCLRAEVLEGSGDAGEAAALFHAILAQDPGLERAWAGLARLGAALADSQQAVRGIEKALERSPRSPGLWYTKALLLKQRGGQGEMVEALERAVALDPRHQGALYALGMERLHQGRSDEAALLFGDLVALEPSHQEGWRNLAIAQTQGRRWEEALDAWRRLLSLAPGDPQARGNVTHLEQFLLQRTELKPSGRERNH